MKFTLILLSVLLLSGALYLLFNQQEYEDYSLQDEEIDFYLEQS